MLRLSKKAEYAIIALKHMQSRPPDTLCTAREIAGRFKISDELMAKILQKMARAGLVMSVQGVRGGYVLTTAPSEITIANIVECIDGPFGLVECAVTGDDCGCVQYQEGLCNISDPFTRLQLKFRDFLEGISLADLGEPKVEGPELINLSV